MPTLNNLATAGDTDLGWAVARVKAIDPVTWRASLVEVTCKGCRLAQVFAVDPTGRIVSAFQHTDACRVLAEIQESARADHR